VGRGEEESWRGREQVWILRLGFVWSWNYEYTCCGVDSGLIVGSGVVNGGTLRHSTYDYQSKSHPSIAGNQRSPIRPQLTRELRAPGTFSCLSQTSAGARSLHSAVLPARYEALDFIISLDWTLVKGWCQELRYNIYMLMPVRDRLFQQTLACTEVMTVRLQA
jgi:hypothetical protein